MRINNNMMAINTHRQLGIANTSGAKSMEKLSSGFRINRAGDDAAGLAISEKMRGQIRGLNQASTNAQDGISLIQTAEGALNETHAILQRMRELAVQASNDTNTTADRGNLQDEVDQLSTEITRIADTTEFNTMTLLDDTFDGKKFHIGANEGQDVSLEIGDMRAKALEITGTAQSGKGANWEIKTRDGKKVEVKIETPAEGKDLAVSGSVKSGTITLKLGKEKVTSGKVSGSTTTNADIKKALDGLGLEAKFIGADFKADAAADTIKLEEVSGDFGVSISSQKQASESITTINDALEKVSKQRSKLGAVQNRLEHTIKNLDTSAENLQASESRIRDVDMAKQMMEQTRQNILQQASTAMLAQANMAPQTVLQLLG